MNDFHPSIQTRYRPKTKSVIRPPSQSLAWLSPFRPPRRGFDSSQEPSETRLSFWPLSELAAFSSPATARCGACGVTRAIRRAITLATRLRFATLPLVFPPSPRNLQPRDIDPCSGASCRAFVEPRFNIGPYHAPGGAGRKFSPCFVMAQCSLSSAGRELWLNYRRTVL